MITGFDHIVLIADGSITATGRTSTVLTAAELSSCFGQQLHVEVTAGRYHARADVG